MGFDKLKELSKKATAVKAAERAAALDSLRLLNTEPAAKEKVATVEQAFAIHGKDVEASFQMLAALQGLNAEWQVKVTRSDLVSAVPDGESDLYSKLVCDDSGAVGWEDYAAFFGDAYQLQGAMAEPWIKDTLRSIRDHVVDLRGEEFVQAETEVSLAEKQSSAEWIAARQRLNPEASSKVPEAPIKPASPAKDQFVRKLEGKSPNASTKTDTQEGWIANLFGEDKAHAALVQMKGKVHAAAEHHVYSTTRAAKDHKEWAQHTEEAKVEDSEPTVGGDTQEGDVVPVAYACMNYGFQKDAEIILGPQSWFTPAGAGVQRREGATTDSPIAGELEVGVEVRADRMMEVAGKMRVHVCEPQLGWVLTMNLACKSHCCGLCSQCLEHGPRATLPSENARALEKQAATEKVKVAEKEHGALQQQVEKEREQLHRMKEGPRKLLKSRVLDAVVAKAEAKRQDVEEMREEATKFALKPMDMNDRVLLDAQITHLQLDFDERELLVAQIDALQKEVSHLRAEADVANDDAEERFINYGSHLHQQLDEATLRAEADDEIIHKFESALNQASDENQQLQREKEAMTRREKMKVKPQGRSAIIKSWPVVTSGSKASAPCPYSRTKYFECMATPKVKAAQHKSAFAALK